jgi:hypothetical protein
MSTGLKQRLVDALVLVQRAIKSPNIFENEKEATFSALRRGCLDLRKDLSQMESQEFTIEIIRDAWLFLMELSKAKLRRKHAVECIQIMLKSKRWKSVLHSDSQIRDKLAGLSKDMQTALGRGDSTVASQPSSPSKPRPSTAEQRKPTTDSPREITAEQRKPTTDSPREIKVDPISPDSEEINRQIKTDEASENNPFRLDFNPFKEARGVKQVSNPYSRKPGFWWENSSHEEAKVWWGPS